jgi:hypothetical protein
MPGKIVSKAQQRFLAAKKPAVFKDLAGGQKLRKNLPEHVGEPPMVEAHVERGQKTIKAR